MLSPVRLPRPWLVRSFFLLGLASTASTCGGSAKPQTQCTPVTETCNGQDDDCNGIVDDATATNAACAQQRAGAVCVSGACACPTGAIECGGRCATVQTDRENCGACGVTCDGTCSASHCLITVAMVQGSAHGLAIDATNLYWTEYDAGKVMKVPLAGGALVALASGQASPGPIAVDATNVYWANHGDPQMRPIMKVPLAGGTPVMLGLGGVYPYRLTVDATSVYWTDADGSAVKKVAIAGGSVATLAIVAFEAPAGIVVSGANVYFTTRSAHGALYKASIMPTIGAMATTVVADQNYPADLVLFEDTLYWANSNGASLAKTPLAGGSATTIIMNQDGPEGIAVDGAGVYWTSYRAGTVTKYSNADGKITTLAADQTNPVEIVVDANYVYWGNQTQQGAVVKTAK